MLYFQCTVNTRSLLYAPDPSEILRGRMPTRSMTSSSIYEQSQCILTTKVVQPRSIVTPFYLHDIRLVYITYIDLMTKKPLKTTNLTIQLFRRSS